MEMVPTVSVCLPSRGARSTDATRVKMTHAFLHSPCASCLPAPALLWPVGVGISCGAIGIGCRCRRRRRCLWRGELLAEIRGEETNETDKALHLFFELLAGDFLKTRRHFKLRRVGIQLNVAGFKQAAPDGAA